ncbi:MAG: tripartite tricarboxylate transporter permease [Kiloniellales bacterium]
MSILSSLGDGFSVATTPINLLFCLIGTFFGTIIGVLPGLGPTAAITMLLPLTFGMDPIAAFIMLAGIYYGSQYGGSTTAILIRTPGESSSIVTTFDGYQMAKQGRAGAALAICAIGSFIAGTLGIVGLMLVGTALAEFALRFGPPEYFALAFFGLATLVFVEGGSKLKALASTAGGFLVSMIGIDPVGGQNRFLFGQIELLDGIDFVVVAMGLFAVAEVLTNLEDAATDKPMAVRLSTLWITWADWLASWVPILRGTLTGFLIGVLPGAGATISTFASYALERRLAKAPETFGKGAIAGVAGPESANNANTIGAFVPLLSLGIPGSTVTAVLLAAMTLHGLTPGPLLFAEEPQFVWGLIASMYIGNLMLLVLNLPLVPLFASLTRVPYAVLYPAVLVVTVIGVYSIENNLYQVWILLLFGVLGYFMRRFGYPASPLVLALVLGPLVERSRYQTMTLNHGDFTVIFTRPISGSLMAVVVLILLGPPLIGFFRTLVRRLGPQAR